MVYNECCKNAKLNLKSLKIEEPFDKILVSFNYSSVGHYFHWNLRKFAPSEKLHNGFDKISNGSLSSFQHLTCVKILNGEQKKMKATTQVV